MKKTTAWDFIQKEAPPATPGDIGFQHAKSFVANLKSAYNLASDKDCLGYLTSWNDRWGSPFTVDQLVELSQTPASAKPKRTPKRGPDGDGPLLGMME